jgi:hypothetical protein
VLVRVALDVAFCGRKSVLAVSVIYPSRKDHCFK